MKRRREVVEKQVNSSELRSAIEVLSLLSVKKLDRRHGQDKVQIQVQVQVQDHVVKYKPKDDIYIPIKPFLSLCNFLLHLLDKIGPTMIVLRQDIHRNIQRLEKMQESDPILYSNVVEIVKKELNEGTSRKLTSTSKAFVWLTRSIGFMVNLLDLIEKDIKVDMVQAVEKAYETSLKPWHGWISSTAYRVALKLVPDNKTMIDILISEAQDEETLKNDIKNFKSLLVPFLDEIHSTLVTLGLDRLKSA